MPSTTHNHPLLAPLTGYFPPDTPQHWADLGCGSGVFTAVLADFLPENSRITAIDHTPQKLPARMGQNVSVSFQRADFVSDPLHLPALDGLLLANSLHFVKDKNTAIRKLAGYFEKSLRFLIVEYDRDQPSQWEPYPLPFSVLEQTFVQLGYGRVRKLGTRKSVYGGTIYAAFISE